MKRVTLIFVLLSICLTSMSQADKSKQTLCNAYVDSITTGIINFNTRNWDWSPTKIMKGSGATIRWVGDHSSGRGGYVIYKNNNKTERFELPEQANATQDKENHTATMSWSSWDSHGDKCQFEIQFHGIKEGGKSDYIVFLAAYHASIIKYTCLFSSVIR